MAQHLSIRVPWHDNDWNGCVCCNPTYNNSCLRLKNIYENRDDNEENKISGKIMCGHEDEIPCVSEGAAFLSPKPMHKVTIHPYKKSNPQTHGHFLETEINYPAYSFPARPFGRLMRGWVEQESQYYNIPIDLGYEPTLPFKTNWIQDARNHKAIFDYFYGDVIQEKSLCLVYAKQVPFIEDSRRVLVGIGRVKEIVSAKEHNHTEEGNLRSMIWETMICHSIRSNHEDGFIFPYKAMMEYSEKHPEFNMRDITVFAPDDYFGEFSYATEHVSYDAVIDILLQSIKALGIINECLDEDYSNTIKWLNDRLAEVWLDRGAFSGLGEMLCALGIEIGIVIAKEIKDSLDENEDIWEKVDKTLNYPNKYLSKNVARHISELNKKTWNNLSIERKNLFKLLSRFSFTIQQASVVFHEELRRKNGIICSDKDIIENPYILYELTRNKIDELYISIRKVDMAIFPTTTIQKKFQIPKPSRLTSDNDERRIRAISVSLLENAALNGHTLLPRENLILSIMDLAIEPKCNVNGDIFNSIEEFLVKEIIPINMKDNKKAYKLVRFKEIDDLIKRIVNKRIKVAKRHEVNVNWRELIDSTFGTESQDDIDEEKARKEKAAVLKELAESRISVLVGDAGTGKTAVLSILCQAPEIDNGGVLLLAPTGKARVRMVQSMEKCKVKFEAFTVAQYLTKSKRYDYKTMTYNLSDIDQGNVPNTVIIDEASMLTEEMFGALLQAIRSAKRIIFVGDPNQLPPIGAGRPFVDLVTLLNEQLKINVFPRVCKSYGELTVHRRQKDEQRLDVKLSNCYTNTTKEIDVDIFEDLKAGKDSDNICIKKWTTKEELESLILETLREELNMKDIDDVVGFNASLGANHSDGNDYFNIGNAKKVEEWQILAPVRNMPHGVLNINRFIHGQYRRELIELSQETMKYKRKIPKKMGPENIVYGDKVINVINNSRDGYKVKIDARESINYVANGEIGIVAGNFGNPKTLNYLKVEFSSQEGISYSYTEKDFSEEKNSIPLELAYALTVHKAQGSQFGKVILILSEPCGLISKEMMYTALTRQTEKLIILYNQDIYKLKDYTSMQYSDIAQRFTDLFESPKIVKVNEKYYEDRLIHRTAKGEMVRSKSEVIIADCLYNNNVKYEYEKAMTLGDNNILPDFVIVDEDTDEIYIWEHCGMMGDEKYRKRWENKKALYEKHGYIEDENLIVTYDEEGSLDSYKIRKIVEEKFL